MEGRRVGAPARPAHPSTPNSSTQTQTQPEVNVCVIGRTCAWRSEGWGAGQACNAGHTAELGGREGVAKPTCCPMLLVWEEGLGGERQQHAHTQASNLWCIGWPAKPRCCPPLLQCAHLRYAPGSYRRLWRPWRSACFLRTCTCSPDRMYITCTTCREQPA